MTREIGDIENDLGFVEGQIDDLEEQLAQLRKEKAELVNEWGAAATVPAPEGTLDPSVTSRGTS